MFFCHRSILAEAASDCAARHPPEFRKLSIRVIAISLKAGVVMIRISRAGGILNLSLTGKPFPRERCPIPSREFYFVAEANSFVARHSLERGLRRRPSACHRLATVVSLIKWPQSWQRLRCGSGSFSSVGRDSTTTINSRLYMVRGLYVSRNGVSDFSMT